MEQRDALFVINQDVDLSDLRELSHTENIRSVVILTTHRIFPNEENVFHEIWADVKIIAFSDLLTEEEMCGCDEIASHTLLANNGCDLEDFNSRFMSISVSEKNKITYEKLISKYIFQRIYYTPGLGVSEAYWEQMGVSLCVAIPSLENRNLSKNIKPNNLIPRLRIATWAKRILMPKLRDVISYKEKKYIFFSPIKRLRIRPGTPVKKTNTRCCRLNDNNISCMTLHGYNRALAEELGGVLVFVDGYHPSNYPRTYIDSYGENDIFVVRTMFDERWFTRYGKKTIRPPEFIEQELFKPCNTNPKHRVLIALNHAGDWTALINRSDTDELVVAAAEMAYKLPELSFRIRTHPTMDHPKHEGLNSSARIERFVSSLKLSNLYTSTTHSLPEDLNWSDICISEYSQVLLDALRNGKHGISINLTNRRSFMQDYADLGFFHAQSSDMAVQILKYIKADPINAAIRQNKATMHYNEMQKKWLSGNQI